MLRKYEGIIFDLDGTLIDSMGIWHQIDVEYLGSKNIPLPDDLQRKIEGMSFYETAVYFKERFKLEENVQDIMDIWNKMSFEMYTNKVTLKKGVIEILDYIKNNSIKCAIATSNSSTLTAAVLKSMKIENYFDAITTACDVKRGKPNPDIYLAAADKLGVVPEKCFAFEDIPNGIMAAKNAGMKICAVEDTYSMDVKDLKIDMADYYTTDFISFIDDYCK